MKKIILLLFCAYSLFFFAGSTLAPILAHFQHYDLSGTLTSVFIHSCHQQPDRTFWITGYPAALCCRCYGFYLGVFLSTLFALFYKLNLRLGIFISLLLIALVDISANYILKINTGNIVRFFIGLAMGLLFVMTLCYTIDFIKEKKLCKLKK